MITMEPIDPAAEPKDFKLDIDSFCEDVFSFLEGISEGGNGNLCLVKATCRTTAAMKIGHQLGGFIVDRLKEVDDDNIIDTELIEIE